MDQPLVNDGYNSAPLEPDWPILFLRSDLASGHGGSPFVAIVRSRAELSQWLSNAPASLQWIQVEELLSDQDAWIPAAQSTSNVPLDVLITDPGSQFSDLYRLVDVFAVRDVRVSMPASPGFLRAVKVAIALRLPVRLLPGQPSPEVLIELTEAVTFYLRDPMVEAPVEFFHSVLAAMCGTGDGSLWMILEEDPALFLRRGVGVGFELPGGFSSPSSDLSSTTFVEAWFRRLLEQDAECVTCPFQEICQGYFKWPDPAYDCGGVKQLFFAIKAAADEMGHELANRDRADQTEELAKVGPLASPVE
ncbi:MAG: hypothetical protein WAK31_08555 [Chthoniobacterales bacterium]